MQQQMVTLDYAKRKQLYDRAQQLIAENLPLIFLGTPIFLRARTPGSGISIGRARSYTLWNADELYVRGLGLENAGVR